MDGTTSRNFKKPDGEPYTIDFDYIIYPDPTNGAVIEYIGLSPEEKTEVNADLDFQTFIMELNGFRMNHEGLWRKVE